MADRYVVKGTLAADPIPSWPCPSEEEAFQKAGEFFDKYGPSLRLEIFLNDIAGPRYGEQYMAEWSRRRTQSN